MIPLLRAILNLFNQAFIFLSPNWFDLKNRWYLYMVKKALQQVALSLIFVLMLFYNNGMGVAYLNFALNRQYIANNLCENRSKPLMNCKGKCYLKKQLQKEEQESKNNTALLKQIPSELFCVEQKPVVQPPVNIVLFTKYHPFQHALLSKGYLLAIFHPPPFGIV